VCSASTAPPAEAHKSMAEIMAAGFTQREKDLATVHYYERRLRVLGACRWATPTARDIAL
jgi:hypothetical protein